MQSRSRDIFSKALCLGVLLLGSCSIKEVRDDCPCYLDVTLLGQGASAVLPEGTAWCGVWTTDQEPLEEHLLTGLEHKDTTLECRVLPKGLARVIVCSSVPSGRVICAAAGTQMPPLYAASREVDCFHEESCLLVDRLDKRHCMVTLSLNSESVEFADRLDISVEAPYNGIELPSMRAREGIFRLSARFDDSGTVSFNLPPQDGPGLKLRLMLEGGSAAEFDLYALMKENLYDWDAWSLKDFRAEVGLNSISHAFVIGDWSIVDINDKEF